MLILLHRRHKNLLRLRLLLHGRRQAGCIPIGVKSCCRQLRLRLRPRAAVVPIPVRYTCEGGRAGAPPWLWAPPPVSALAAALPLPSRATPPS